MMQRNLVTFVAYSPNEYEQRLLCVYLSILFAHAHTDARRRANNAGNSLNSHVNNAQIVCHHNG